MKTAFISTSSLSQATRLSLTKLQAKLVDAQKEVSSGRYADVGATLGYKVGQTVSLRQQVSQLGVIADTNSAVSSRLDATQGALKSIAAGAQSFIDQLLAARNGNLAKSAMQADGKASLGSLTDALNTAVDGTYIFGGINSDTKP